MDLLTFKCPKCDYSHVNLGSLRIHWSKLHKCKSIDLRIALFGRHNCECGCGEQTRFLTLQHGFSRFRNGHNDRVHNNWGHNSVAKVKSHAIQKEMRERGEWKPNPYKGLTKETDERLVLRGERIKAAFTPEKSEKYSKQMSQHRLDGTIPTLRGKDHSQWKGGSSALQPLCRSHVYRAWSYPKMKEAAFKCRKCGKAGPDLEVHHDEERFAAILQKAIQVLGEVIDDDFAQKSAIAEWVTDYHINNDVSGVVLCESCHDGIHSVNISASESTIVP